ncbi:uncharacterized protein DEA37_0007686 [Paragonimus westermani]|uniref:Uncharacterized protein n=1 Tax=Paragonimus westermani TaxID=34504 RepID=A0A5J4NS91_9TREM|nr:uncharacterized protein DEA37_0007686 [Paragonimus westermani]
MRLLVLACLVVALFIVYSEARPDSQEQLRETGKNLYEAIRKAVMKIAQKCKAKIDAYLEKDGLGDKISEVIQICKFVHFPMVHQLYIFSLFHHSTEKIN